MSKVILTNEVSGLGSAGDVVEVKNGYARNYLLPRGFAVLWTKGGEKQVVQIKAAREARALATVEEAQAMKERLQANPIKLAVKAGVGGRLFGAVKTADVAAAVAAAGLGDIDKRKVAFFAPIRSTGNFEATVKLHSDLTATLKLQVVAKK
jgi:large subunit ribosomal protein L9